MASQFDVLIIGRGAAAFAAAIKISELSEGKTSVAMIGKGQIGGTCVNVGCVPSKYLLQASHDHFYPQHPKFPGIEPSRSAFDFGKVMGGLRGLVSSFREAKYEKILKSYQNVELIEGAGRFSSPTEVEVLPINGSSHSESSASAIRSCTGRNIIIATGSSPTAPPIEGLAETNYLTSDTVWNLEELPESIAIIGGGAIGLEIGQAFLHFGSEVSVVEALPRIMTQAEPEISEILQNKLAQEGMKFYIEGRITKAGVKSNERKAKKKFLEVVTAQGKSTIECDEILVATGRAPNTNGLSLEKAGVKTDKKGSVITDSAMRTSNPKVYAAGDCVSKKLMLETLAAREGVVAAANIMGGNTNVDYLSTPWAVFTNPQIAAVGLTEEDLMKQIGTCSCRVVNLGEVPKAIMLGEKAGLVKLIINPNSERVVGLHILSPLATEFVLEGVYAIKYGLTFEDIVGTTHIFPTLAEGIKLTAQSFLRDIEKMSCCVE